MRSSYFFQATQSDSSQVKAIRAIVQTFGWREAVPIFVDNEFGEGVIPSLSDALKEVNARIPDRSVISFGATDEEIERELFKLMSMQSRVFIVHMIPDLGSRVFDKATEIGMMCEGYVWIITDGMTNHWSLIHHSDHMDSMQGVLGVRNYVPKSKQLEKFEMSKDGLVKRLDSTSNANLGTINWPGDSYSIPKGWEISINGRKLKIGVLVRKGFKEYVKVTWDQETNSTTFTGSCIDVFSDVMKKYDAVVGDITIVANRSFLYRATFGSPAFASLSSWHLLFGFWSIESMKISVAHLYIMLELAFVWFSFSTMTFAHRERVLSNPARIVVIIWCIVVFPRGSPLVADVSRAILNVTESFRMGDIQNAWKKQTNCPDSSSLDSTNSLSLGSFWGLFLIAGVIGVLALVYFAAEFLYEQRDVLRACDAGISIWNRILQVLRNFDRRDLTSHAFRQRGLREEDSNIEIIPVRGAVEAPVEIPVRSLLKPLMI
ncbi:hypothetical protein SLEP1_g35449 [Rubroshorea leprosula]|uniref:Ionotropic glutamate receptor C-terminal domain-containing protein n=1 Tax=Rubroshorea leprosula TaxID=152421 RepID=A0AAV5KNQ7_9ROSI|nr:hypothetical protein SLEP1_g35449 [Rubroshorea leprosula]